MVCLTVFNTSSCYYSLCLLVIKLYNQINVAHLDLLTDRYHGKSVPALLPWKAAEKMVPWGVVLLLGGGFALAHGSQVYQYTLNSINRTRNIHLL